MGAGQSIPSTLTRQKVFELTRDTRGLMNILLEYMLKEVTVRDFVALSNPTECKKYVIFMANALNKSFYELQIVPTKDKKGVIAFRPIKELITQPQDADNERQSLCLTLAYFYTRIFQIYGALALTLIDDATYMSESGLTSLYSDGPKQGLLPPGFRQYVSSGGTVPLEMQGDLGNFYFLNTFLDDKTAEGFYQTVYEGSGQHQGEVLFDAVRLKREGMKPILEVEGKPVVQKGTFYIGYKGAKKYAELEVAAWRAGVGVVGFKFGPILYTKKGSSEEKKFNIPQDIIRVNTLKITSDSAAGRGGRKQYIIEGVSQSISEYFNTVFYKLIPLIKTLSDGDSTTDTTSYTPSYTSSSSGVAISEVGTAEELHLARTINNLQKTKPLGHCLARAMQLLGTLPLGGRDTFICKAKFLEQTTTSSTGIKTTVSRSGIPGPGMILDDSPGLAATVQLFYDTIVIGTPKIIMGDKPKAAGQLSSIQQYIEFMKKLAIVFGDYTIAGTPRTDDSLKQAGLKGIRNRRDRDWCGAVQENISIPANTVASVYDIVNQLYKRQLLHSNSCGKIFRMLFSLERDKASGRYRISLSNNIIQKGFPEIERINYEARKVLVEYYTKCEETYLVGMNLILKSKREAAATAARLASTAAGPAGRVASAPAAPGQPLKTPGLPGIIGRPAGIPIPVTSVATGATTAAAAAIPQRTPLVPPGVQTR